MADDCKQNGQKLAETVQSVAKWDLTSFGKRLDLRLKVTKVLGYLAVITIVAVTIPAQVKLLNRSVNNPVISRSWFPLPTSGDATTGTLYQIPFPDISVCMAQPTPSSSIPSTFLVPGAVRIELLTEGVGCRPRDQCRVDISKHVKSDFIGGEKFPIAYGVKASSPSYKLAISNPDAMLHVVLLTGTNTSDSLIDADGLIPPSSAIIQLIHPGSAAEVRNKAEAKKLACSSKAVSSSSSSWMMVSGSYRGQFQLVQEFGLNANQEADLPEKEFYRMTNLERIADRNMHSADMIKLQQLFPAYQMWLQQLSAREKATLGQLVSRGHLRVLELFLQYSPSLSIERYGLQETYTLSTAFGSLGGLFSSGLSLLGFVIMVVFGCARSMEVRQLLTDVHATAGSSDSGGKDVPSVEAW
eukprot:TRINITY_DN26567_c0_g1_i1.p1 TRINITY_DN26567_c0_g1~~TRINITY_DN26567_c0_g1_i1.p1  ORF type:complete len:413 (-),score=46.65 TRINITY_DN26567_c0_g1_i1:279-1517(-)